VLFPTLRKLGISFYAYSPIAGGFLTKTKAQVEEGKDAGRFSKGHAFYDLYSKLYNRPLLLEALQKWEDAAKEAGVSNAELAYRWVAFDSPLDKKHGDAIIFGASKYEQIQETLQWLKNGKLPANVVEKIDAIWKDIEHEAPLDNIAN
jgi:aflatoxin B1 aldehyde reductase